MKSILFATLAGLAACNAASAADGPSRRPIGYSLPATLSSDELRDYHRDQLENRQEMERRSLALRQKAERRLLDPEDDD